MTMNRDFPTVPAFRPIHQILHETEFRLGPDGVIANPTTGQVFDPLTNTISFPRSRLPATVARPMAEPVVSRTFKFDRNAPAFQPSSIEDYPDPFANDAFRAAVFPTPTLPASEMSPTKIWEPWNQGIDWSTLWKQEVPQVSSITRLSIEQEQPTITPTQDSAHDQSASSTKKTVTAITVAGATIPIRNFNKNPDESYTAVSENYSVRAAFNAQGLLPDGQEVKINYKNRKTITHSYEGPVTVINHQIIPQGHGRITKSDASITAEFVAGEIIGNATIRIRNSNREYRGPIDEYFSPICQATLRDDHCELTGEFDSQLQLWGKGKVAYHDDKGQLLHTVLGEFKADKITQGRITMPNGDYYEGLIKDNHLPDKGTLYFNLDLQPPALSNMK